MHRAYMESASESLPGRWFPARVVPGRVEVPAGGQEMFPVPCRVELSSGRLPRLCWASRMRNDSPSVMTTLACSRAAVSLALSVAAGGSGK
jgi:hypothetical protein